VYLYAYIIGSMNEKKRAIEQAIASIEEPFFKALAEPSRLAVLQRLMMLGRADIAAIAEGLPQERSVVSRHLQCLNDAGIVCSQKVGRQVFYEVDGPAVVKRLEEILIKIKRIAPFCCPGSG